jgi:DNA-binding response OmpR family regulator
MSAPPGPVLLVDADRRFGEALAQQLAADGYRVEVARSVRHARILAEGARPRVAVLGGLEEPRGALELLEEIRCGESGEAWDSRMAVLVIGQAGAEIDALRAFDAGADDHVVMPVAYLELRARVAALLRRADAPPEPSGAIEVGTLRIDTRRRAVTLAGAPVELRRMEYELLLHLCSEPDRVFSREELLQAIWGYRSTGSSRTVDTHASRLRMKLRRDGEPWLVGVWGVGYRLR